MVMVLVLGEIQARAALLEFDGQPCSAIISRIIVIMFEMVEGSLPGDG